MTERIFEQDAFARQTVAAVTGCIAAENGFAVTLDKTVFFPEGGGQPGDRGRLGDALVLDTQERDGEVVHLCDRPLKPGDNVEAVLDFDRRFDMMQQHTGEHMLSYAFWKLFDAVNVGFHLTEELATLDLDRPMDPQQIRQAVAFANRQGFEDHPIRVYTARAEDLDPARVRKISAKGGQTPRVVDMEEGDVCTCCGTHVRSTGQALPITVTHADKHKAGVRLTFLCGGRALAHWQKLADVTDALGRLFSTDAAQLPDRVRELQQSAAEARRRLRETTDALAELEAARILAGRGDDTVVLACLENTPAGEAKTMLNLLIRQPVCAVVVYTQGDTLGFYCGAHPQSKCDCRQACELLCGILNGKGGGKPDFAQGGAKKTDDWQERVRSVVQVLNRQAGAR